MLLGHFDDLRKEYVINTPKTPYPWINYLGSESFFSLFSNTAGGYAFYKDARLRRITRYRYNNVPVDNEGRYFYVNDGTDVWSLGYKPVQAELDFYECRHGMGYSSIETKKNNLLAKHLAFVPLGDTCEVHQVTLKNEGDCDKTFKVYSYIEFCLWDASDDMLNFQRNYNTGEVEVENSVIYHKTEYRERRNHYSFYSVNEELAGFDTDRESFVGLYNDVSKPDAVFNNKSTNKIASGWSPIASHCVEVTLKAGESKALNFVLGYIENDQEEKWLEKDVINKSKAYEMIDRYKDEKSVKTAFEALGSHWEVLLSKFNVKTEDDRVNRMVNIWNAYQCMVTFNLSRSASFFESGVGRGMGFRDSNQDILGFVHQIPERARERLIDLAATQLEDGGAYHQYQPLTKKGNHEMGGGFNDDPMWMILSVAAYIKETGDFSILEESVPYNNDEALSASMLDHVKRSFFHVVNNLGPNGLPLIGRADWNDCLNLNCFSSEPGESFQTAQNKGDGKTAESVFIAGLFILAGKEYVDILGHLGLDDEKSEAQGHMDAMEKVILDKGFDGDWFLRAYDAYGNKVGSKENEEGKIFIEPQGICVMAGVGVESGQAKRALDNTRKYLDTPYGMVLLNPAYTKYHLELGEITSYPPGYKENAGIFCHNNPWVCMAEAEIGRGDEAFEIYSKICPAFLQDEMVKHRTEPYVYSQMIAGKDAVNHGEAKNSWLTGTAAWNFLAITQGILGIKPTLTGLKVDPCIPKEWGTFTVTRHFRGAIFDIEVINEKHVSKGVEKMLVDGSPVSGNIIEFCDAYVGKNVKIKVYLG